MTIVNDRRLDVRFRLRMYHRDAITVPLQTMLCNAWNDLLRFELRQVMRNESVSAIFKDHMDHQRFSLDSEKFKKYLESVEWFYRLERNGINGMAGFMTVSKDREILSIFIEQDYRGWYLGSYLINNHMEVFGGKVTLKCFKFNKLGMAFYKANGFRFEHEAKESDNSDMYHTLSLTV